MWLCNRCHRDIHLDEHLAALRGHIVHSTPADTPCLLARHLWARLHPDGSVEEVPADYAVPLITWLEARRDNPHVGIA